MPRPKKQAGPNVTAEPAATVPVNKNAWEEVITLPLQDRKVRFQELTKNKSDKRLAKELGVEVSEIKQVRAELDLKKAGRPVGRPAAKPAQPQPAAAKGEKYHLTISGALPANSLANILQNIPANQGYYNVNIDIAQQ